MLLKRKINFLNSSFFNLKLYYHPPSRNLWPPMKVKKNSKNVWKFSWMLNEIELNAVLSKNFGICLLLCSDGTGLKIK